MKTKLFFLILFLQFSKVYSQEVFTEKISNSEIKTILFYGFGANQNFQKRALLPPIINLNGNNSLFIEFDDLRATYSQFSAKIIHCETNWVKSNLNEMEYLEGFNEFFINTFDVSQNTKIPYYHFRFKLPKLKVSGNYVLQIFEDNLNGTILIQKKFQIFEQKINILAQVFPAQDPNLWKTSQQINVSLNHGDYRINNAKKEIKVVIRQNFREDKTIELNNNNLINAGLNEMKFNNFNNENVFLAGNEFRYFNASSSFSKGDNIKNTIQGKTDELLIIPQTIRSNKAYLDAFDNNGQFILNNNLGQDLDLSSDYISVKIVLNLPKKNDKDVPFVIGKFNNWNLENAKLEFNPNTQMYEKSFLLKQGIYDYAFGQFQDSVNKIDETYFEGNFSDTKNTYEIFVYQKSPSARASQLVGYRLINMLDN